MGELKEIVCLADSRKHSGRCIAGKELTASGYGRWIRPVSVRQTGEISEEERRYENGATPKILDIIEIPMIGATPILYQSENYVIDANCYWVKKGMLSWPDVKQLLDHPASLWANYDSTIEGRNDRVKLEVASTFKSSLMLIEPQHLKIKVHLEGSGFGNPRRKVRAEFSYASVFYSLVVTDPVAEARFLSKPNAEYQMTDTYLCISLGEAYGDSCYKLVAAVLNEQFL